MKAVNFIKEKMKTGAWAEVLEHSKWIFFLIHVMVFFYFLIINIEMPYSGDDIVYRYVYGTNREVSGIGDVAESMVTHYFTWGGRVVVHALLQLFLSGKKLVFDFVNAGMFLLFAFLIYRYILRRGISNSLMLGIYLMLWISLPGVGEAVLHKTNSCVYLWGTDILLLFFYPFYRKIGGESFGIANGMKKWLYAALMLPFGIIAGWTIEAGGAMVLFAIGCIGIYEFTHKKKICLWQITGFVGGCIGYAALVFAPGNYVRVSTVAARSNILSELLYRLARETYYMLLDMWWLLGICIILLYYLNRNQKQTVKEWIYNNAQELFFLTITLLGVYVMTLSSAYAERVLLSPIAFLVIAVGMLYRRIDYKKHHTLIWLCLSVLTVYVILQAGVGMYQMIFTEGAEALYIRTEYIR